MKGRSVIVVTLILLCMSLSLAIGAKSQAEIVFHGTIVYSQSLPRLYVEENIIRSDFGPFFMLGCNVRGRAYNPINDGRYDDWYTDRVLDSENIRSFGFNTIRLVTYWESVETSTTPSEFVYNDTYIDLLRQTVEAYNQKGIYVIIDLHEHGSMNELAKFIPTAGKDTDFADAFYSDVSNTSAREHLSQLWLSLSQTFRNYSGVAGYDICNEPHRKSGALSNQQVADLWFDIADYVIASLRASGDNHIVFVNFSPGARNTSYMSRRLNDDNVVYCPHFYQGIEETYLTVRYNDYSQLQTDFENDVNARMLQFSTPFIMEEQGFGSNVITIGDARDLWLKNAITIHRSNPLMQGWLYWCYVAYNGAVEGGGWQTTLIELFGDKPI